MIRIGPLHFDAEVTDVAVRRDQVTIAGAVDVGSLTVALHLAEQISALAELPDEAAVPIICDAWTGMAVITSADWTPIHWERGEGRFTITARPLARPTHPQVTSAITAQVRQNSHELYFGAPFHAVPAGVTRWSWQPTGTAVNETRPTAPGPAAGDVAYRRVTDATGQSIARWSCPPDQWYAGGCHAETYVDDRWMPIVGRGLATQPWRISNGLVEVTLVEAGPSAGRLRIRWWRPDVPDPLVEGDDVDRWAPTQEFGIGLGGGLDVTAWRPAEIVEASPHRLKIRIAAVRTAGLFTLWLTIRRGSRLVDCTVDTDVVPGHRLRVRPAAATVDGAADSPLLEGWHGALASPLADSGLAWVVSARDLFTHDTATGTFTPDNTLAAVWSWGISAYFDGADDDTGDVVQCARDWFCAQSEAVTVR